MRDSKIGRPSVIHGNWDRELRFRVPTEQVYEFAKQTSRRFTRHMSCRVSKLHMMIGVEEWLIAEPVL